MLEASAPARSQVEPGLFAGRLAARGQTAAKLLWSTPLRRLFTVFVLTRVAVLLAGWLTGALIPTERHTAAHGDAVEALASWDGYWYVNIAAWGYHKTAFSMGDYRYHDYVFFPLYPLLVGGLARLVGWTTYDGMAALGIALSSALLWGACTLMYRYTAAVLHPRVAERAVLYLLLFPLSFVFSMTYTESLYLLLVLAAFALARQRRWAGSAVVAAAAAAARLVGVLLVVPLGVAYLRRERRKRGLLVLGVVPLGLVAYVGYLTWLIGTPTAIPAADKGWDRAAGFPGAPLVNAIGDLARSDGLQRTVDPALNLAFVALFAWLLVELVRRRVAVGAEHLAFCAVAALPILSSGSYLSLGRYGMVVFPFFWALGHLGLERPRLHRAIVVAGLPALVGMTVLTTSWNFVP